jgi:two-component system, cell cycle sensor histidine kinase and response regulator CckA
LFAVLQQLAGRSLRRGDPRRPASPAARIDMGDLSIAQLVHDLKNQLTVVIGCADNLAELVADAPAVVEIVEIRSCAARASSIAQALLTAARPRPAGGGAVDLNHLVAPAAETLARVLGPRIRVEVRLSADPVRVRIEPADLERILLNLALNARSAIEYEGTVTIVTELVPLATIDRLEGQPPGPYARLTVTDTGRGMTREIRERMFEPFFSNGGGTGLGLSSVAFTVNRLHGTISVESRQGRGTSISVYLPLASSR